MGSSKSTSTSNTTAVSDPWSKTMPALSDLVNRVGGVISATNAGVTNQTETDALNALAGNAAGGNQWAPAIGKLATDLLGGGVDRSGIVNSAYSGLQSNLNPYITGSTDPYSNPAFQKVAQYLTDDAMKAVKSSYAGAGIPAASYGDFGKSVGEGISRGIAPTWLQAYNDLEARKGSAIRDLYSGGNTTAGLLSGLDQTALGNRQAGVGVAESALQARDAPYLQQLNIEQMRRSTPLSGLAGVEQLLVPLAQLGRTQTQNTTTESKSTPSLGQQILGGVLGGVGTLGGLGAFGPTGWLFSSGAGGGGLFSGMKGGTGLPGYGGLY